MLTVNEKVNINRRSMTLSVKSGLLNERHVKHTHWQKGRTSSCTVPNAGSCTDVQRVASCRIIPCGHKCKGYCVMCVWVCVWWGGWGCVWEMGWYVVVFVQSWDTVWYHLCSSRAANVIFAVALAPKSGVKRQISSAM